MRTRLGIYSRDRCVPGRVGRAAGERNPSCYARRRTDKEPQMRQ